MSDGEVQQLRIEVAGLREELESVQAELVRLRRSFATLRVSEAGNSVAASVQGSVDSLRKVATRLLRRLGSRHPLALLR